MFVFRFSVVIAALALAGCAAHVTMPVSITQADDDKLNCADINAEMKMNSVAAADYVRKDKDVEVGNVVGTVVFPGLINLSNTEQVQARSLMDRNERLAFLAKMKGCSEP